MQLVCELRQRRIVVYQLFYNKVKKTNNPCGTLIPRSSRLLVLGIFGALLLSLDSCCSSSYRKSVMSSKVDSRDMRLTSAFATLASS